MSHNLKLVAPWCDTCSEPGTCMAAGYCIAHDGLQALDHHDDPTALQLALWAAALAGYTAAIAVARLARRAVRR